MSFFDTTRPERSSNYRKTEHVDLSPGQSTIRILDAPEEACKYSTHYIKRLYIKCLGEDCPICANNMKIYSENPDNYRDVPGWSPKADRYAVNVLDKTPVKICPSCGREVKKNGTSYPPICPQCQNPIIETQEAPLNKIKVLAKGVTVADLLNGIHESVLNADGEKLGINNFDIVLYVTGTGKNQTISPIPLTDKTAPVDIEGMEKFDLTKIAIELTVEEIYDLQKGISLKDIFASRRSSAPEDPSDSFDKTFETAEDIKESIDKLLK